MMGGAKIRADGVRIVAICCASLIWGRGGFGAAKNFVTENEAAVCTGLAGLQSMGIGKNRGYECPIRNLAARRSVMHNH